MEEFNIAEALKYAPKGLKLYSPLMGEVELNVVFQGGFKYPIEVKSLSKSHIFTEHGRYLDNKGECLLFPSKDHRTWDNWQSILFPQSVGSVCVNTGTPKPTMFICTPNGTIFDDNSGSTWDSLIDMGGNYLNSSHYATPEKSEQFFAKLKANGYELDVEKKELIKLQSGKFNISTLRPFDKVLVRDNAALRWGISLYGYYNRDNKYPFVCNSTCWKQCVPYNDDTKHLVGTTDDAPEYYKTWNYE